MKKPTKTARDPEGNAAQKPKPQPIRPEPNPQMVARMALAQQRNAERLERPTIGRLTLKPKGENITSEITIPIGLRETLLDAFGTTSMDFVTAELERLSNYHPPGGKSDAQHQRALNAAIAVIDGTRPENEAAAMLASQMAVTHALAMDMLGRAKRAALIPQADSAGSLAVKLLRTYSMQAEALAKLKRGGEQTVRVEHVHVYPGGQAIVGAVSNRRGEGGESMKKRDKPMERVTCEPLPLRLAPRCLARTRAATPCQKAAATGKKRCPGCTVEPRAVERRAVSATGTIVLGSTRAKPLPSAARSGRLSGVFAKR
jgi:hypothetical protein